MWTEQHGPGILRLLARFQLRGFGGLFGRGGKMLEREEELTSKAGSIKRSSPRGAMEKARSSVASECG